MLELNSPSGAAGMDTGSPGHHPEGCRARAQQPRGTGAWGLLPCLLSVLFLPGTSVPPTAPTEALPTVQLSNASLASLPGSLSPEPSSLFPAELCVSVPLSQSSSCSSHPEPSGYGEGCPGTSQFLIPVQQAGFLQHRGSRGQM